MKTISLLAVLSFILLAACQQVPVPTLTPTPTATATRQPTATATPTPSPTSPPTPSPEPGWYQTLDPASGRLIYSYALVTNPRARVYTSLQDAAAKTGNFGFLPDYPAYVAYITSEVFNGRTFYQIAYGWAQVVPYGWMDGADLQLLAPSTFTGILLTREVSFRFGWVLADSQSVNAAGMPVQEYHRYQVIHEVDAPSELPGSVAVGVDEWLPEEDVTLIRSSLPADVKSGTCRFIYANLKAQTLSVYDGCKLVFATLISSGKNSWTFEGRFNILNKSEYQTITPPPESTSEYFIEGVPYFMTYAGNFGFHGAYWHDDFGTAGSHGCINLSPADAKWLYDWANLGDVVIISPGE
jgi:lipoprotein-anchoring transpeptidase ErfK/SrfK